MCGLDRTDWLTSPSWSNQDVSQSFYLILDLFGSVSYHDNLTFSGHFTMNSGTDVQCSHSMNLRF